MYTYCTVYFTFSDKRFSFFQITGFFIGGTAVFEALVFTPGQNNLNTILFQDRFTFQSNSKINIFFFNTGSTYFPRVSSAMSGIKKNTEVFCCLERSIRKGHMTDKECAGSETKQQYRQNNGMRMYLHNADP